MSEPRWDVEPWEGRRAPLPRVEDLPVAEHGYERVAVERAFEAFYRHTAELDATLRVLESVDAFSRAARELRADIRDLRSSSWGPLPGSTPVWTTRTGAWDVRADAASDAVLSAAPRLALEAAVLILAPVLTALAGGGSALIIAAGLGALVLVATFEILASTRRFNASARAFPAPAAPAPAPFAEASPAPPAEAAWREEPPSVQPAVAGAHDDVPAAAPEPEPVFEAQAEDAPPEAVVTDTVVEEEVAADGEPAAAESFEGAEAEAPEAEVQAEVEVQAEPPVAERLDLEVPAEPVAAEPTVAETAPVDAAEPVVDEVAPVDAAEAEPVVEHAAAEADVFEAPSVDAGADTPEPDGARAIPAADGRRRFWRRRREVPVPRDDGEIPEGDPVALAADPWEQGPEPPAEADERESVTPEQPPRAPVRVGLRRGRR